MSGTVDPIGAVEDAMIARLKAAFGWGDERHALAEVEALEFPFDQDADKVHQVKAPAAYVVPLAARGMGESGLVTMQWAVYAVSGAPTARARARGTAIGDLGAYAIAARIAAALDGWVPDVEGASGLECAGIEVLTGLTLVKRRLSVLAVTFTGPLQFAFEDPEAELADFLHYHSDWDLRSAEGRHTGPLPIDDPHATTDVTLPGSGGAA